MTNDTTPTAIGADALIDELDAAAPKAAPGEPPGIQALMCVISSLRDTAHFSDEEGELTNDLRTLRDWAYAQTAAKAAPDCHHRPRAMSAQPTTHREARYDRANLRLS